jgi:hypothetical protein
VDETSQPAAFSAEAIHNSYLVTIGLLVADGHGVVRYNGQRPGPEWHAHGSFDKFITVLKEGEPTQIVLRKQRWKLGGTNTTCHSRPPDDPVGVRFCTMIIVLRLWACLIGSLGFHNRTELLDGLGHGQRGARAGSDRTVQRWLARAQRNALPVQQAIRQAVLGMRKVEPRPEEDLFRRGRSPPVAMLARYRNYPESTSTLWRALDMLFVAAKQLPSDVALLLAEARRRWLAPDDIFPL